MNNTLAYYLLLQIVLRECAYLQNCLEDLLPNPQSLFFLRNLQMGQMNQYVSPWRAFPAYAGQAKSLSGA